MSSRVIQSEEIKSLTGVILAVGNSRFAIDPDLTLNDLEGNECITKDMADESFSPDVPSVFRELKPGQTVPYPLSLPSSFNGRYQLNVKIDRGGDIWENYSDALVKDDCIITKDGDDIIDYYVNRVDIYGVPAGDGTNLEHLIFTFSKA